MLTCSSYLGTLGVPPLDPHHIHADAREKEYEKDGTGTMYLFRLDATSVVDATRVVGQRTGLTLWVWGSVHSVRKGSRPPMTMSLLDAWRRVEWLDTSTILASPTATPRQALCGARARGMSFCDWRRRPHAWHPSPAPNLSGHCGRIREWAHRHLCQEEDTTRRRALLRLPGAV